MQINTFTQDCKEACRLFHERCRFRLFIPVTFSIRIKRMFMMHFTGVSLKAWKAKEGECKEKCEEAGGPIFIVRECEPETGFSCKGQMTTKKTTECTTYCSSTAGRMKQFYIVQTNPAEPETADEVPLHEECHCKFLLTIFIY